MFLKVSKRNMAYDTSFAKSKVPFTSTIATFRGRSFKPAVVVLYKTSTWGFRAMPICIVYTYTHGLHKDQRGLSSGVIVPAI